MENKELVTTVVGEAATETAEAAKNVVINLRLQDVALIGGMVTAAVGVCDIAYELAVKPVCKKLWRKVKTKFVVRKLSKAKDHKEETDPMELTEDDLKVE